MAAGDVDTLAKGDPVPGTGEEPTVISRDQRTGIGVRIGHGPLVVDVDGPDPHDDTAAEDTAEDTAER